MTIVTACTLAYNEERNIRRVLNALAKAREADIVTNIGAVDDGSTDGTADIVREFPVTLLQHLDGDGQPENLGKAQAFLTGLRYAVKEDSTVFMVTDADMYGLDTKHIQAVVEPVASGETPMAVMSYFQQRTSIHGNTCSHNLSGFRALSVEALRPIYDTDHPDHRLMRPFFTTNPELGFSLEPGLEYLLGGEATKLEMDLKSRGQTEGASSMTRINKGIQWGGLVANALYVKEEGRYEFADRLVELAENEGIAAAEEYLGEEGFGVVTTWER